MVYFFLLQINAVFSKHFRLLDTILYFKLVRTATGPVQITFSESSPGLQLFWSINQ